MGALRRIQLIDELQSDDIETFLKIGHALDADSLELPDLTAAHIEDLRCQIFIGSNFTDLRRNAAYERLEMEYPDEYAIWKSSHCDGFTFDPNCFLDSPAWSVQEVTLWDSVALLVAPT